MYTAAGMSSWFSAGPAYDGEDAIPVVCVALIKTSAAADEGFVLFDLEGREMDGHLWDIRFDHFTEEPGQSYQEGGVRAGFEGFGSTGRGGPILPEVPLEHAGWGEAEIRVGGSILADPVTGQATWKAMYAVAERGIRENSDGSIRAADGEAAYDPSKPDDARTLPNQKEMHVVLQAHAAPPQAPMDLQGSILVNRVGFEGSHILFNNTYPGAEARMTLRVENARSALTVRVEDPKGEPMDTWNVPQSVSPLTREVAIHATWPGQYRLRVEGDGLDTRVSVNGTLDPPETAMYWFWWNEIRYGDEAIDAYEHLRHAH